MKIGRQASACPPPRQIAAKAFCRSSIRSSDVLDADRKPNERIGDAERIALSFGTARAS